MINFKFIKIIELLIQPRSRSGKQSAIIFAKYTLLLPSPKPSSPSHAAEMLNRISQLSTQLKEIPAPLPSSTNTSAGALSKVHPGIEEMMMHNKKSRIFPHWTMRKTCVEMLGKSSPSFTPEDLALGRFWELKFTPRSITTSAAEHFTRQFSATRKNSFDGLCKQKQDYQNWEKLCLAFSAALCQLIWKVDFHLL